MRLPIAFALERDANRRAKRLLSETKLADVTEEAGIADLLRAALRLHLAFSVGLILLVGACVATMSLVESGLDDAVADGGPGGRVKRARSERAAAVIGCGQPK